MRQLMCHQPSPLACPWYILPCPEHNILSQCISLRIQCPCRFSRLRISMHPHRAKINSKPRLEIGTLGFRQRLAVGNRELTLEYLAPYVYRVVGFVLPSVYNRHKIESQKTRKAALTIPNIQNTFKSTLGWVHKPTSKSH